MPTASLDLQTPVIIAVGQCNQRVDQGAESLEPVDLMVNALELARADAGDARVLTELDEIRCVHVFSWRYRDPGRLVAQRLGLGPIPTTFTSVGGNVPQMLINEAARDIASGNAELIAITGAEAVRSRQAQKRAGVEPDWVVQGDDIEPTRVAGSIDALLLHEEIQKGIALPVQLYPIFESAWRASQNMSLQENNDAIATLWSRFSQIAAANPHAWHRRALTPDELLSPAEGNRMIGYPYRKYLNSYEALDQGAAVIVASLGKARALGIADDRLVFLAAGTDAHDAQFVSHRSTLAGSPAIRIAGRRVMELAGVQPDDLDLIDVYSCFPSAVQIAAHELGFGTDRDLTVTGGLSFAGGPWSNYVTHSVATMTEQLREHRGVGLITANGGFLTKHAFGVYTTEPPKRRFQWESPQNEIDSIDEVKFCDHYEGNAVVEGCTVMHSRTDEPERAIVAVRTDDGQRAWAFSTDADTMQALMTDETVGRTVALTLDDTFTLTDET